MKIKAENISLKIEKDEQNVNKRVSTGRGRTEFREKGAEYRGNLRGFQLRFGFVYIAVCGGE